MPVGLTLRSTRNFTSDRETAPKSVVASPGDWHRAAASVEAILANALRLAIIAGGKMLVLNRPKLAESWLAACAGARGDA